MSFSKIAIIGNLTRDVESRYMESGNLIASFGIAADGRKRGSDKSTTFFNVSSFGEVAERLASMVERGYIHKGSLLYVEGQFEVREYTAKDGTIRTSLDVTLTDWQFVGSGQQQGGNDRQADDTAPF